MLIHSDCQKMNSLPGFPKVPLNSFDTHRMLSVSLSQGFRANEAHPCFFSERDWGRSENKNGIPWLEQLLSLKHCSQQRQDRDVGQAVANAKEDVLGNFAEFLRMSNWRLIFSASQNSSKTAKCWFIDQTWRSKSIIPAIKSLSSIHLKPIQKGWKSILSAIRVSHGVHQHWSVALPTSLLSVPKYLPNASPQVWRELALKQTSSFRLQKLGQDGQVSLDGQMIPSQFIQSLLRVSTLMISLLNFGLFKMVLLFRLSPAPIRFL